MIDLTHYSSYFSAPSHETSLHETVDKQYSEMKPSFLLHWVCRSVQHSKANIENIANCSQDARVTRVQWVNGSTLLNSFDVKARKTCGYILPCLGRSRITERLSQIWKPPWFNTHPCITSGTVHFSCASWFLVQEFYIMISSSCMDERSTVLHS